jgi:hypothetical protein
MRIIRKWLSGEESLSANQTQVSFVPPEKNQRRNESWQYCHEEVLMERFGPPVVSGNR